ncbi:4'-phosphopantetheinyl transferase family protein [Rothia aerolata]|uniref:4'-phosphopantetheinyl transferase domain-containing protein n=1 Tax=Rothia aerolata TaxID=1812262 RepID=A0A917IRW7_9MICC|nr:4'-phosphopantetheinyl transferase family protein [Rothia aerolata]GGH61555.1 hypothetical protein GCM10007359_10830 [Rothia aerolata]
MASSHAQQVDVFVMPSAVLRSGHGVNWLSFVGIAEQMKAAEYRSADDATLYAAQQTLMRAMAASALGVRPTAAADIPVDRSCRVCRNSSEHGKPLIAGVNLSMSRTTGMVAGALTSGDMTEDGAARLGADIERLRGNFLDGFDRVALTEAETTAVEALDRETAQLLRLLLWTGKEAVLKATGHGLVAGPDAVEFSPQDFPRDPAAVAGFSTRGVLTLAGQEAQEFWVGWQVQGEYFIAVALDRPLELKLHPVTTPLEVKRIIEAS